MPSDKRQRKRQNAQIRHQALAQERRRADFRRRAISAVVVLALFAGVVGLITAINSGDDTTDVSTSPTTDADAPGTTASTTSTTLQPAVAPECPPTDGSAQKQQQFTGPFPECIDTANTYRAVVETDVGSFTIELLDEKAPKTVNNFVSLARYHYYDGVVFHRVIPGFVVQGGDPTGSGNGDPGYEFDDELPEAGEYEVGSVAMANSGADTNGSQFFVVTGDEGVALPPKYSLFGTVVEGMDVVKSIEADGSPGSGEPKVTHRIETITIEEA